MLFKASMKLYFLLSILIISTLNSINAEEPEKVKENNDQFYMIITENNSENGKRKREEIAQFLDALVTEINNLIIGNKDTYDDQSILKILEEAPAPETTYTKRSNGKDEKEDKDDEEDDHDEVEAEDHKFAYVISSLDNESIISSYLSEELVPIVKDMPSVKAVIPDFELGNFSIKKHLEEIKEKIEWTHPCVNGNVYNHLSLISQGKFDDSNKSTSYDENYYYPSSADEGINIFILDSGFNFAYDEFSYRSTNKNKNERIATCIGSARTNRSFLDITDRCPDIFDNGHGNAVANIAGGLTNGVASKANIYGFITQSIGNNEKTFAISLLQGLEHINSRFLNETIPENVEKYIHKSVINMSCGYYFTEEEKVTLEEKRKFTEYFGQLIKRMSDKGSVFFAAAGNDSVNSDDLVYPCSFDDVICVGATDNIGINDDYYALDEILKHENDFSLYPNHDEWNKAYEKARETYNTNYSIFFERKYALSKSYRKAYFSNYGQKVDIYAPGFVKIQYRAENNLVQYDNWAGTSFASPIVAGVAATIMSENPNKNYTTNEMREELQKFGLKNILQGIEEDHQNIFINNGKYLRYNFDNEKEDEEDINEFNCYDNGCCLRD